jgi:hypothetical protein
VASRRKGENAGNYFSSGSGASSSIEDEVRVSG